MPAGSSVEAAPGGSCSLGLQRPQVLQVRCPGQPCLPGSAPRSRLLSEPFTEKAGKGFFLHFLKMRF